MRLATFDELRSLLNLEKIDVDLLAEAFKMLDYGHHYLWLDIKTLEEKASEYAIKQGWDPDTTLVLYSLPQKPEDIDPDDIQIGTLNPNQAVCTLYPDLSIEKLAETLNRISRLKVFL